MRSLNPNTCNTNTIIQVLAL